MIFILTLAIIAGQIVKLPIPNLGLTLLDFIVVFLCSFGLYKLKLKFKFKKPPLFITAALIFISIALISLLLSPLHLEPLQKLISFSYIVRFFVYILLGWLIYEGVFPFLKENIIKILLLSGFSIAVLGLLQLIIYPDLAQVTDNSWDPHYFRTVSTFLDPNFVGAYFVLTLLLLIPHKVRHDKVIFAIIYIALLTTFSRGAYFMFIAGFGILTLLNKSIKLAILSFFLILGLFLGFNLYQKYVAEPRNIDRTKSASFRVDTWKQGWAVFKTYPILGVGFNSYRYALKEENLATEQFISSRGSSYNDSSLLHVAATTGIVGLLSYLLFLGSIFWTSRKNPIIIAGLGGLIIQSFFVNTLFYPFLLIWIILFLNSSFEKSKESDLFG